MKKFVLIEVIEREISIPHFFDTHEEAYQQMKEFYNEAGGEYAEEGEIWKDFAWLNSHHNNFDWKIFEVEVR